MTTFGGGRKRCDFDRSLYVYIERIQPVTRCWTGFARHPRGWARIAECTHRDAAVAQGADTQNRCVHGDRLPGAGKWIRRWWHGSTSRAGHRLNRHHIAPRRYGVARCLTCRTA